MSEGLKKGWHPDPFGHYAERYYYADGQPGRLVRDDGRHQFYDELPIATTIDATRVRPPARSRPTRRLPTPTPINAALPPEVAARPVAATGSGGADPHSELVPAAEVLAPKAEGVEAWPGANDYFPDERVPWRVLLASRIRNLPRPSLSRPSLSLLSDLRLKKPSRKTMYATGMVLGIVVLGVILVVVMSSGPGSSPPPSSAASSHAPQSVPPTQPPSNLLNGGRGSGSTTTDSTTTTSTVATADQSWATNSSYASSSLNLSGIACPSATQCYAVGETAFKSAMVLASTNGGASWSQQNVQIPGALTAVACWSSSSCIAVGGTTAASTTDGGTTWTPRQLGSNALTGVTCPSASTCLAVGSDAPQTSGCDSGVAYATHNGGQSWSPSATHCFVPSGISCATATSCMMSGTHTTGNANYGAVLRSSDGGKDWRSADVLSQPNTELTDVACPSRAVCVAVGNGPGDPILRTTDAGATWTAAVPAGQSNNYLAVSCASTTSCQAGGMNSAASTINGTTWTSASLPAVILKVTGLACPTASQCNGVAIGQLAAPWTITLSA